MFKFVLLLVYLTICFIFLSVLFIITPRLVKNNRNETTYICIAVYIVNIFLLTNLYGLTTFQTVIVNIFLMFISYYQGSRLRVGGLTGQISSGKSTVANYIETKHGGKIINIDELNKEVLEEKVVLNQIRKIFGDDVFTSDGKLNKIKMREIIYSDIKKKKQLEKLTHFKVFIKLIVHVLKEKILYGTRYVFIENAILLRFSFLIYLCHPIVSICTNNTGDIISRLIKRDNCNKELAENMLKNQMTLDEFKTKSDVVIYNDGSLEDLYSQIDELINKIKF
jgi:dephospho-CoA kinase